MKINIASKDQFYNLSIQYEVDENVDEVWQLIATNSGFAKWFPELKIEDQADQKVLVFEMADFREEMTVRSYSPQRQIAYDWAGATITFTIEEIARGSQLVFEERIPKHFGNEFSTPSKDMAGWLVQNECLFHLLNGEKLPEVKKLQQKWESYVQSHISDGN